MRVLTVLCASLLLLAGCSDKDKRVYFAGNYYPTKAKKAAKGDRETFVVNVRRGSQGLEGAREAGRHGGVKYCVETFGYSGIDWIVGPDEDAAKLVQSNGNLVLTGRCRVWE